MKRLLKATVVSHPIKVFWFMKPAHGTAPVAATPFEAQMPALSLFWSYEFPVVFFSLS